ncbi:MAG: hypothetical protein WC755_02475 [Candidatus Woesearchaeota archaeon]|jgi:hypothetical protein
MKLKKLAQTATEYLIILAVVIVIALIVVSVMGGIPGIGKSGQDKAEKAFWATSDIAIPAYANTQNNNMTINMRNNLQEGITLNTFSLDGVTYYNATAGFYVESGETINLPVIGKPVCTAGDTYSYAVEINYTTMTGKGYTFNGYGHKLAGQCGN